MANRQTGLPEVRHPHDCGTLLMVNRQTGLPEVRHPHDCGTLLMVNRQTEVYQRYDTHMTVEPY